MFGSVFLFRHFRFLRTLTRSPKTLNVPATPFTSGLAEKSNEKVLRPKMCPAAESLSLLPKTAADSTSLYSQAPKVQIASLKHGVFCEGN